MTPEEAMRLVVWNDQSVCEPIDGEATAANILAAVRAAVERERERCADIAVRTFVRPSQADSSLGPRLPGYSAGFADGSSEAAVAIAANILGVGDSDTLARRVREGAS